MVDVGSESQVHLVKIDYYNFIGKAVYHSYLRNPLESILTLNSITYFRLPIEGGDGAFMLGLNKDSFCPTEAFNRKLEVEAELFFASELRYIVEEATKYENPIFQEDIDTNDKYEVMRQFMRIDRSRICLPVVREKDGVRYLDLIKGEE